MRSPSVTTMIARRAPASCRSTAATRPRSFGADEQAARPLEDVAEALARQADRRRVDDRHHLVEMVHHDAIEERLVAVLQRASARCSARGRSAGARRLSSTRSTCSSCVATCGGSSPRSPSASRSSSVNAVPLLRAGSCRSAIPRGRVGGGGVRRHDSSSAPCGSGTERLRPGVDELARVRLQRFHVVRALERVRIGAGASGSARPSAARPTRIPAPSSRPRDAVAAGCARAPAPFWSRRRDHHAVGAGEQQLQDVLGVCTPLVAASSTSMRPFRIAIQRSGRRSSSEVESTRFGATSQRLEVDVGLHEAVEQHEPVGAGAAPAARPCSAAR